MQSSVLELQQSSRPPVKDPVPAGDDEYCDREQAERDRGMLVSAFSRERLWERGRIDWIVTIFMVAIHLGCIAAPFFFTWTALGVCLFLHWLTCSIGICLGYHRYLSHKALKLRRPAEFFVLACGAVSGEGPPLTWASTHRLHHQRSDQEGDPHSPLMGPWWSHILWLFIRRKPDEEQTLYSRYIPELVERPLLQFFERTYAGWLFGVGLVLLWIGWLSGGPALGLSLSLWGLCVRMTLAYHSTWFVNSATHLWGYRNYQTRDASRNLWWVALLAYGEGWHNNHHAHPGIAPAGHRRWEIDVTWWSIRFLRWIGQAYDVRDRIPEPNAQAAA